MGVGNVEGAAWINNHAWIPTCGCNGVFLGRASNAHGYVSTAKGLSSKARSSLAGQNGLARETKIYSSPPTPALVVK